MTTDTQQYVIRLAAITLAAITIAGVVFLALYAVTRDGSVANEIIGAIEGYLQWVIPSFAALAGVHTLAQAFVASRPAALVPSSSPSAPAGQEGNAA